MSPKEAVIKACRDIVGDLGTLSREFTKEWELKKLSRTMEGDGVDGMNGNGYM